MASSSRRPYKIRRLGLACPSPVPEDVSTVGKEQAMWLVSAMLMADPSGVAGRVRLS